MKVLLYLLPLVLIWGRLVVDDSKWDNHYIFRNMARLDWRVDVPQKVIYLRFEAHNPGWIGIGWSPSDGQMQNADMVIMTKKNGEYLLGDYFSQGFVTPILDDHSDITMISGGQEDGTTWMEFSRSFDTGDSQDRPITQGSMRIVWALGRAIDSLEIHSEKGGDDVILWPFIAGDYSSGSPPAEDGEQPSTELPPDLDDGFDPVFGPEKDEDEVPTDNDGSTTLQLDNANSGAVEQIAESTASLPDVAATTAAPATAPTTIATMPSGVYPPIQVIPLSYPLAAAGTHRLQPRSAVYTGGYPISEIYAQYYNALASLYSMYGYPSPFAGYQNAGYAYGYNAPNYVVAQTYPNYGNVAQYPSNPYYAQPANPYGNVPQQPYTVAAQPSYTANSQQYNTPQPRYNRQEKRFGRLTESPRSAQRVGPSLGGAGKSYSVQRRR